jgi:mannose-6-phosphate isomerase
MGTHPTSPSLIKDSETLASYLQAHPELIGSAVTQRFPTASEGNLPFLLKVLSIDKALSIQTHPNKETAEKLHAELPHIYKGKQERLSFDRQSNLVQMTTTNPNSHWL